ncbi:hypothetical protein MJT46_018786 [Ovis ammon polii x Ovis aries]|nr:hypothetical protein MJT46_018786 [Ovis ammon polii x Ovis aries]
MSKPQYTSSAREHQPSGSAEEVDTTPPLVSNARSILQSQGLTLAWPRSTPPSGTLVLGADSITGTQTAAAGSPVTLASVDAQSPRRNVLPADHHLCCPDNPSRDTVDEEARSVDNEGVFARSISTHQKSKRTHQLRQTGHRKQRKSKLTGHVYQSYLLVCEIHSKCDVFKEQQSVVSAVWWLTVVLRWSLRISFTKLDSAGLYRCAWPFPSLREQGCPPAAAGCSLRGFSSRGPRAPGVRALLWRRSARAAPCQSWEAVLSLVDTGLSQSFAVLTDRFFTGIFTDCVSTTEVPLLVVSVALSTSPRASTLPSSGSLVLRYTL